jgi:hypothetical protein
MEEKRNCTPGAELPDCPRSIGGSQAAPARGARRQSGKKRDCTPGAELPCFCRVPSAGAARPLVHKIVAML